jgi:hypothetical protein
VQNDFRFIKNRAATPEEPIAPSAPCVYPAVITSVTEDASWETGGRDGVKGRLTENEVAVGDEYIFAYDTVGNGKWGDGTLTPHLQAGVKTFVREYDPACAPESATAYTYKLVDLFQTTEGADYVYPRAVGDGWIGMMIDPVTGEPRLRLGDPQTTLLDTTLLGA